jgi:curved DNA-binding protein CbpA
MDQILALAKNFDATQLRLTAAEGFLLSRIDGSTPWRLLREMGGAPPDVVDACLTRWIEEGLLEVVGDETGGAAESKPAATGADTTQSTPTNASETIDAASAPPEPRPVATIDESLLDEALEIDLGVQRRILEFEASLGLPYAVLLGVPVGSEAKVVKRAYFKLSKEFHPDRFFRKEIGDYSRRLERIFKKVLEAHEILSDPKLCEVENRLESEIPEQPPAPEPVAAAPEPIASPGPETPEAGESPKPRALTKLERLKQRMPFKIDHAAIAARRSKADGIFRAACLSQKAGKFQEAESGMRIAISFDPMRTEFKEALGALRLESAGAHASKLLAMRSDKMSDSELREALALLEDVLIYRPHDPLLNERAARVCLQLKKFDLAEDYAQTLVDRCPDVAENQALLGQIHRGNGNVEAAVRAFEAALKIDQENPDARRALAAIRIGHHDAVQGGGS